MRCTSVKAIQSPSQTVWVYIHFISTYRDFNVWQNLQCRDMYFCTTFHDCTNIEKARATISFTSSLCITRMTNPKRKKDQPGQMMGYYTTTRHSVSSSKPGRERKTPLILGHMRSWNKHNQPEKEREVDIKTKFKLLWCIWWE